MGDSRGTDSPATDADSHAQRSRGHRQRIVVTGIGVVSALGVGVERTLARLRAGESGLAQADGRCAEFDPLAYMSRKVAKRTERFAQLTLAAFDEAAYLAWGEAECPADPARVACLIGIACGGVGMLEAQRDVMEAEGAIAVSPFTIPLMMANAAPAVLAIKNRFTGPCTSIMSGDASSAQAIGAGVCALECGDVDLAVVGGSESMFSDPYLEAFARRGFVTPSGEVRPFDRRRDGWSLAEASSVLILERAESAARRGAAVLGEILGFGAATARNDSPEVERDGLCAPHAVSLALRAADVDPGALDALNAHGTATQASDAAEALALRSALGARLDELPVCSIKGAVGYTLGAAGALDAAVMLLALRARTALPTPGCEQLDETLRLPGVASESRPLAAGDDERAVGLSTTFGLGGNSVALVLAA
jgi:3-oxoacyl-[acyl-carrier-protein] synthase II